MYKLITKGSMKMKFEDFKTELKNTPVMLKIASLMYIIPALVLFVYTFSLFIKNEHSDFTGFLIYFIYALFNILIGSGLYKKNVVAWWIAVILPFLLACIGIAGCIYIMSLVPEEINLTSMDQIDRISITFGFMLYGFVTLIGLYHAIAIIFITRPKIKALFKKGV